METSISRRNQKDPYQLPHIVRENLKDKYLNDAAFLEAIWEFTCQNKMLAGEMSENIEEHLIMDIENGNRSTVKWLLQIYSTG